MSNFFNSTERSSSPSTSGCWFCNLGAEPSFVVLFIESHEPFEEAAGWTSTSQSCFLLSNWFFEQGHSFGHTWACYIKCTASRPSWVWNCILVTCSACSAKIWLAWFLQSFLNMPKSSKWEKRLCWQGADFGTYLCFFRWSCWCHKKSYKYYIWAVSFAVWVVQSVVFEGFS